MFLTATEFMIFPQKSLWIQVQELKIFYGEQEVVTFFTEVETKTHCGPFGVVEGKRSD